MVFCTFAGHREVLDATVQGKVETSLDAVIKQQREITFYTGSMGEFDRMCSAAVRQAKKKYPEKKISLIMVSPYVRMLINASTKKVAIQCCSEKTPNAIEFSQEQDKQSYAISLKVPALLAVLRKQLPELEEKKALSFKGELYLEERAIIYDLTAGKAATRQRRSKQEMEMAQETTE